MVVVEQLTGILTTYGLSVIGAILILIIGVFIAGRLRRFTERSLDKIERFDPTLSKFLPSSVRYVVLAVTVVAVLDRFGVETMSLIAVLGAAGLAIGLALQGTLSNIAAGVMLLIFRPLKIGDSVEVAGHRGSVKGITLFVTELADSSVNFVVRVWCRSSDYSPLKFALTKGFKEGLDRAGISMPFPQRDIHVFNENAA